MRAWPRPRTQKDPNQPWQRIGRLAQRSRGIGQHYDISVHTDPPGARATAVHFQRQPRAGSQFTHPGAYCLRSNETDLDEEQLWRTFTLLTDVEAVFRALKSELGLRPIYHRTPRRADGHLFITVLAYQLVQVVLARLVEHGNETLRTASWTTLRRILGGRQRVTATFIRSDGRIVHVRKATRAEPLQQAIPNALGTRSAAGGTHTAVV